MAAIINPNTVSTATLGAPGVQRTNPVGGTFTDSGTIAEGAQLIAFKCVTGTLIVTCPATIAKVGAALGTWTLTAGEAFNPPIMPGATFAGWTYDTGGGSSHIYACY